MLLTMNTKPIDYDMQSTTAPLKNTINVVSSMHLSSSTKDSLHVTWEVDKSYLIHITEYKLRYQAQGSSVVEYTPPFHSNVHDYNIKHLHENTEYNICVETFTNISPNIHQKCLSASTSTDSLHVALGSTFGAFLALGIIVLFVFIAKWQHTQKLRRQTIKINSESYECIEQKDDDDQADENSDISLQVDGGTTIKFSEFDSEAGTIHSNGILSPNGDVSVIIAVPSLANCSECSEAIGSSSYIGGSSSRECCYCSHDDCCGGNCGDPDCLHNQAQQQQQLKRKRDQIIKQRSMDSRYLPPSSSRGLPYQMSIDLDSSGSATGRHHGGSRGLPHQLSVDSYPTTKQLRKQKSRESTDSQHSLSPIYSRRHNKHKHGDQYHSRECCSECCHGDPQQRPHRHSNNNSIENNAQCCKGPPMGAKAIQSSNTSIHSNSNRAHSTPRTSNISLDQSQPTRTSSSNVNVSNTHSPTYPSQNCVNASQVSNGHQDFSSTNQHKSSDENEQKSPVNNNNNPFINTDGRPPDVRPKNPTAYIEYNNTKFPDKALNDPVISPSQENAVEHAEQNSSASKLANLHPGLSLKPNLSCPNW